MKSGHYRLPKSRGSTQQQLRIQRLLTDHTRVTAARRGIRKFVAWASQKYDLEGPVLDVGCGYRWNEPELCKSKYLPYYTLDADGSVRPDFILDVCDMRTIPAATFGTVACTEVLEHIESPWLAMSEILRVMRSSGILIVTVPFWIPIHCKSGYRDLWRFTPDGLAHLLAAFRIELLKVRGLRARPMGIYAIARKI